MGVTTMADGWVPYFDQSFQQATNLKAAWDAGFRVLAGYVAGGSSSKWVKPKDLATWMSFATDEDKAGFFPLFEAVGTEPVTNPGSGDDHARTSRAACRKLGIPDHVAISPAMDRDISMAQAKNQVAAYMRAWKGADTVAPFPYVEMDAGAYLYNQKLSVGTFTPAAYSWDASNRLVTPDNAPAHVMCTQEHNGVSLAGGDVDKGHIRTSAPIFWKGGEDVPLTDADVDKMVAALVPAVWGYDKLPVNSPPRDKDNTAWTPLSALTNNVNYTYQVLQLLKALNGPAIAQATAAALKAQGGTAGITQAQMQQAFEDAIEKITVSLTTDAPAS